MKNTKILLGLLCLLTLIISNTAFAAKKEKITWEQPELVITAFPGTSQIVETSFTPPVDYEDLNLQLSRGLSEFVQILPITVESATASIPTIVQLLVAIPADTKIKDFEGSLRVTQEKRRKKDKADDSRGKKKDKKDKKDKKGRTIPSVLKIELRVHESSAQTNPERRYLERHYLAADSSMRFEVTNIQITNHQAAYRGKAFGMDQPWESDFRLIYPGSTVTDPTTGEYRMYYEVAILDGEPFLRHRHVAMATSADGINWSKPALNLTGNFYSNNPDNNLVSHSVTAWANGASVFVDPSAPASERYKMVHREAGGIQLLTSVSADGFIFHLSGIVDDLSDVGRGLDSQNLAFWDPKDDDYKSYMRYWYPSPDRRGAYLIRSSNWNGTWNSERELVLDPDYVFADGLDNQLYTPGIFPYHGQYIGLPSVYRSPSESGRIAPSVMHSTDGSNWEMSEATQDFFDGSVHTSDNDDYMIFAQPSVIEQDDELLFYYSYINRNHEDDAAFSPPYDFSGEMHIASLRRDGFTSLDAYGDDAGIWITDQILISPEMDQIFLNGIINGNVSLEILDALTLDVVDGYSKSDSIGLKSGDYLDGGLKWTGERRIADLSGRNVRFKFYINNASVFSFRFSAA